MATAKKVERGKATSLREAETREKATPTARDVEKAKITAKRIGGLVKALAEAKSLAG